MDSRGGCPYVYASRNLVRADLLPTLAKTAQGWGTLSWSSGRTKPTLALDALRLLPFPDVPVLVLRLAARRRPTLVVG
jgi:hypothetical protein